MSRTSRLRWVLKYTASGPSPTCDDRPIEPPDEWGVLKTTAIQWSGWNDNEHKTLPKEYWGTSHLEVHQGDVLVTKAGPRHRVGVSAYVNKTQPRLVVSGKMLLLRVDETAIDARYLNWQLATPRPQAYLNACKTGMAEAQMNFANEDLLGMEIDLPPLDEQRRIADFLDAETARIDKLHNLTAMQLALLKERQQEALRSATTTRDGGCQVATDIPWMPTMNDAWRLYKISHHFRTGSGTTPTSTRQEYFSGSIPWVVSADLNDGDVLEASTHITDEAVSDFPALTLHSAGSLIIAMYGQGATKGTVGVLRLGACVNQACCVLTPVGSVSAEFASYWFRAHKNGIIGLALGAGQPNLSQELIRQLWIPAPSPGVQAQVVAELRGLEDSVERNAAFLGSRITLLGERRQALITAAVTGQFDVTSAQGLSKAGAS